MENSLVYSVFDEHVLNIAKKVDVSDWLHQNLGETVHSSFQSITVSRKLVIPTK